MASISSLSGTGSSSSIYGNRNIISGLASGMDTESMIENAVSGIKLKISKLQQKRTKVEWQQEAYRSIIDKVANFASKYTSYTSGTNLSSNAFFNNAVKVETEGEFKDMISASGKTSSEVKILGVKQLASAAVYKTSGLAEGLATSQIGGGKVDLSKPVTVSTVSGNFSLHYGGTSGAEFDLTFDETDTYESVDELANAIRTKLGEFSYTTSAGEAKTGADVIKVTVEDGEIKFSDGQDAGNSVYIKSAAGDIKDTLGIETGKDAKSLKVGSKELTEERENYLEGKSVTVSLNGVSKTIDMPAYDSKTTGKQFLESFQKELDDAFGKGKIQIDTSLGSETDGSFTLSMKPNEKGSTLSLSGDAAAGLGLSSSSAANYINTGKTLGELMKMSSVDGVEMMGSVKGTLMKGSGSSAILQKDGTYKDSEGNRVDADNNRLGKDGKLLYSYDMVVNGESVGTFTRDSALESVMLAVNSSSDANVNVSYSKLTNEFRFTASETGSAGRVEMGEGLAQALFGSGVNADGTYAEGYTAGKDAILSMSVNGTEFEDITRSNNTFDVDGLSVKLKGTFNYTTEAADDGAGNVTPAGTLVKDAASKAVSFNASSDADKIVDAIKTMVEDYNAMVSEIKSAYSTMPATNNNKERYEPLTDEDKADLSDSAIEAYEEKAKQGILFMDSNLSGLYEKLRSAISPAGTDGAFLRSIGISTSYSDGLTTLSLDEGKLRSALENNPDSVRDAFTKSKENGASTNGLMQSLLTPLNTYGKVVGEPKGILVTHAGSIKAVTTINNNTLQSQMNNIDDQIERWQTKLSDQIDRYTTKFSQLEQLIAEMNSQSSTLMGLMGGSSY